MTNDAIGISYFFWCASCVIFL